MQGTATRWLRAQDAEDRHRAPVTVSLEGRGLLFTCPPVSQPFWDARNLRAFARIREKAFVFSI